MNSYHFIAIGGAIMHNLALALAKKGHQVSGSDDEIYEPSRSRLEKAGILPDKFGWYPEKIHEGLDGIILGMHARIDNPELIKAKELGIPICSFPEFVFNQSQDKKRVVIAGSHGKTSITSIILHVLRDQKVLFDFLVGAQIEGFDLMVGLSDAPVIIIEGDEYLTSPLDRRPKFYHYKHDIALVSGIAWDHFNVFPDFDEYKGLFANLMKMTPESGTLIYCEEDPLVKQIAETESINGKRVPYPTHPAVIKNGKTYLITDQGEIPIHLFGDHNLQNLNGALKVCLELGLTQEQFYQSIQTFKGAAKRLELLTEKSDGVMYRDFAHAPSKLKATVEAVKRQFPERNLVAVQELHTYSSLNRDFLPNYAHTMDEADEAIIYLNPHAAALKKLEVLDEETLKKGFERSDLKVFTQSQKLFDYLISKDYKNTNLLMMSSGNYDNLDLPALEKKFKES